MSRAPVARIAPGSRADVGVITWAIAQVSGRVTGTTAPNLFLVLGRHRSLFRGWLRFAARLMPAGRLPRRDTEMVILRVAHLTGCAYELAQHRRLAVRAGLTEQQIADVLEGPAAPAWGDRERAVLAAVDELVRDHDLSDAGWGALGPHLDERLLIELVLLTAHYEMLATTITALRIPLDRPRRRRG